MKICLLERFQLALSCQSTTCDTVGYFLESRIHVEHFRWSCLIAVRQNFKYSLGRMILSSHLRVFATLEERCNSNESNIIIPHDAVLLIITRDLEDVLKNCSQ